MAKIHRKRRPSTPGAVLKGLFLEPRGIGISEFAEALDLSRKHVSQIVNGRSRIEPRTAARIAKALGTSTRIWLDLQAAVDAWDAEQEARGWKPGRTFPAAA
jgi:addiction module HigA family antidote